MLAPLQTCQERNSQASSTGGAVRTSAWCRLRGEVRVEISDLRTIRWPLGAQWDIFRLSATFHNCLQSWTVPEAQMAKRKPRKRQWERCLKWLKLLSRTRGPWTSSLKRWLLLISLSRNTSASLPIYLRPLPDNQSQSLNSEKSGWSLSLINTESKMPKRRHSTYSMTCLGHNLKLKKRNTLSNMQK